jgi:hypothetical protein
VKQASYPHKVAAVYPDSTAAEAALNAFNLARLSGLRVTHLTPGSRDVDLEIEPEVDETRNTVVEDTLTGGAAGTATGAAVAGATALLAPALFVSSPVIGPLVVLGYGAMIGSAAGAIRGLRLRETLLAGLVKDVLKAGFHVVLVHAETPEAQQQAQTVIDETMTEETAHT